MTPAPPVLSDATARNIRVLVPGAPLSLQSRAIFFAFSHESSAEYFIREWAFITAPPLDVRTEARQRLAVLRERAARRVRLLPAYEETADEIAERSADHQALFEMQWRSKAWSSED